MSMKSILATMSLFALATMSNNPSMPTGRYIQPSRLKKDDEPLMGDIITIKNPPKGHKIESVDFTFNWQDYTLNITCEVSYGTPKSKTKAITAKKGYLADYIRHVGIKKIIEFNQFSVIKNNKE